MVVALRTAHRSASSVLTGPNLIVTTTLKDQVESICRQMIAAHASLSELQTAFDNATIAARIANHLEPSPADLAAAYTAARQAWFAMANDYGAVVLPDMGSPWDWNAVDRVHSPAVYDIDSTANFRTNLTTLRDALAVFA
ncbi:MAG TPA: hypothetical protein VLB27_10530 [candidate division Zixibacteria bacterium]|nr:hypothetical protein [candidate division Zixibacteria bacterium]